MYDSYHTDAASVTPGGERCTDWIPHSWECGELLELSLLGALNIDRWLACLLRISESEAVSREADQSSTYLHAFNSNCRACKLVKTDSKAATGLPQGLSTLIKKLREGVE